MQYIVCWVSIVGLVAAWSGNTCYIWRIKRVWQWGCIYRTWAGCCAWGNINVEVRHQEYFCCSGWRHNGNEVCNIPTCPYDCGGSTRGTCTNPGVCRCNPGYTGTYCMDVAACSYLKPCYPGYCTSNACMCTNKFFPENSGTSNCLNFPTDEAYYPSIEQSTLDLGYYHQVKKMLIYNMTIDSAMSTGNVETFWTNRRDANRMNFTFQSIFSPSTLNFPSRPNYIVQHTFGITKTDVNVVVTNLNNEEKYNKVLGCNGVSRDNPVNEQLYRCDTSIDDFNIRFDSGDTYSVTFRAENGGFRILDNGGGKQYYTGRSTTRRIDLKFDTEIPYHCSERSECTYPVSDMMSVQNDVTKAPIQISWKGWKDQLSKVARYALEVFKLVKAGDGTLKEPYTDLVPNPVPITIREFNETTEGGTHSFAYLPNEPGVYSWILEINDRANNSAYVRRFVIYDPISRVTSDKSHPFYATSGNSKANYEWQNINPNTFTFTWKNHFLNELHENGNFLARIRLFPSSLDDGGDRKGYKSIPDKYDDTEGKRSRDAIPNERGIIKYDVAYNIGKDQLSPLIYQYRNYKNNSIETSENQNLQDGNSFSIWVKAYDILGNTKEERFVLHYDSSKPTVSSEELQKNVEEDKMNFTSSVRILGVSDPHSGVKRIKYRFRAQSTLEVINNREYEYLNPARDQGYCIRNPCDSNLPTGESFGKTIDFPFSNCYVTNVSDVLTETVTMEMDVYNSAGLYVSRSLQITNLTSLRGVHNYFGPIEIKISDTFGESVRIFWNWAQSCYSIQGFQLTYSRDGKILQSEMIFKVRNWIILDNVEAGRSYRLQLYTLYGEDPKNPIKSVASNFSFSAHINKCAPNPCQNFGTCTDGISLFSCICDMDHYGSLCENRCRDAPCQNGATCSDVIGGYRCLCPMGYSDVNCSTDINECTSNPCQNFGTCTDGINSFSCLCDMDHYGHLCENRYARCRDAPCENNATCSDVIGGYRCLCPMGYSDVNCSTAKTLQDSNSDHLSILYGVISVLCISLVVIGCLIAWIIRRGACKRPEMTREVTNARSPADDVMSRPDTYDTVDDTCNTTYQELGQISSPSNYDQLLESRQDKRTSQN